MRESQTTSTGVAGLDLHLDTGGGTVRAGLERALREAVTGGRLVPGTRLPSSRALAADLGLARATVTEAYGQLLAEGWLTARQGSGTVVTDAAAHAGGHAGGGTAPDGPSRAGPRLRPAGAPRADLRAGYPDVSAFPRTRWLAAARRALATAPHRAIGYGDPSGNLELREALAGYLARARGVRADPDRVVVCAGFTHALAILAEVLGPGPFAVEAYGHALHRDVLRGGGVEIRPIPVDRDGIRTDALTDSDAAALLTPAHQFPLGVALAPDRRARSIAWARRATAYVVEDDYDGEFRYDRQPVGALQALDPERVIYAGTASKSLAPALRLGWLVLPRALLAPVTASAALRGRPAGAIEQLTLAEFLRSGDYDRQVRSRRLAYRRRRDLLVREVRRAAPAITVTGIAAGLHAVLTLPRGIEESAVVAAASAAGVDVDGLSGFAPAGFPLVPETAAALVVGYGTPSEHRFPVALSRLCAVLGRACEGKSGESGRRHVDIGPAPSTHG